MQQRAASTPSIRRQVHQPLPAQATRRESSSYYGDLFIDGDELKDRA
jgi:hypothetical protein